VVPHVVKCWALAMADELTSLMDKKVRKVKKESF
jgi:hypothetical protein